MEGMRMTYSGNHVIRFLWERVLKQRIVNLVIVEPRLRRLGHRTAIVLVLQGSLWEDSRLTSPSPVPVWKTKCPSCFYVLCLLWMRVINSAGEVIDVAVKDGLV